MNYKCISLSGYDKNYDFHLQTSNGSQLRFLPELSSPTILLKGHLFLVATFKIKGSWKSVCCGESPITSQNLLTITL